MPSENELVFVKAGQAYLEEKTFHYLSNSLFDISDTDDTTTSATNALVNADIDASVQELELADSSKPTSRNKFGVVDEEYGHTRFGAMFMDHFTKRELTVETEPRTTVNSAYFIFYGIEINLSANLLHR